MVEMNEREKLETKKNEIDDVTIFFKTGFKIQNSNFGAAENHSLFYCRRFGLLLPLFSFDDVNKIERGERRSLHQ
jgi:hypothetical protein